MIQDIAIEQLDIHPQNVRKVYTDIDELAESIKARGVMQNLTVVPNPDKKDHYLVVIGNRRLTAARKAGLKTMPCSVVEMTEKEQISTMLLENMQRSDLSVSEQAQGFQLMLDLGETETTIAEKTGFSRSTVRHRLNLAKLDQETLTRREENKDFQLTLTDLYELEKVQDIKKRNEILKTAVSSREIAWKAKQAVKEEKIKKNAQIVFEILEEKGVKAAPKRAKEEEKERIEKEFAEISQEKQMLILLTRTAEPYEATDYYGHYEKGMKCLRDFYRLLQQMGFSFRSLEELKILNGTHELYTQETEDEH